MDGFEGIIRCSATSTWQSCDSCLGDAYTLEGWERTRGRQGGADREVRKQLDVVMLPKPRSLRHMFTMVKSCVHGTVTPVSVASVVGDKAKIGMVKNAWAGGSWRTLRRSSSSDEEWRPKKA